MKTAALVVGLLLLAAGIASFVPAAMVDGMLFGIFPFATPLAIAFIVTGAIGVMIGLSRKRDLVEPRAEGGHDMRDFGL
jgi:hypothetical protein